MSLTAAVQQSGQVLSRALPSVALSMAPKVIAIAGTQQLIHCRNLRNTRHRTAVGDQRSLMAGRRHFSSFETSGNGSNREDPKLGNDHNQSEVNDSRSRTSPGNQQAGPHHQDFSKGHYNVPYGRHNGTSKMDFFGQKAKEFLFDAKHRYGDPEYKFWQAKLHEAQQEYEEKFKKSASGADGGGDGGNNGGHYYQGSEDWSRRGGSGYRSWRYRQFSIWWLFGTGFIAYSLGKGRGYHKGVRDSTRGKIDWGCKKTI